MTRKLVIFITLLVIVMAEIAGAVSSKEHQRIHRTEFEKARVRKRDYERHKELARKEFEKTQRGIDELKKKRDREETVREKARLERLAKRQTVDPQIEERLEAEFNLKIAKRDKISEQARLDFIQLREVIEEARTKANLIDENEEYDLHEPIR